MVYKIKLLVFFIILSVMCLLCFTHKGGIETNLIKTLLPQDVASNSDIIAVANKSSSVIKVVFESDSEDNLQALYDDFIDKLDKTYFDYAKPDFYELLQKYLSQPMNFLSGATKNLLKLNKYDEVYNNGINTLYSPIGMQFSSLDKDPYFLADDFIMSNNKINGFDTFMNGKYYNYLAITLKNNEGLSPDIINKKIYEIVNIQKTLSNNDSRIYLAGTPIHSYYTSHNSVICINVICILSVLLIIVLTYLYLKNLKLLIPISLSIIAGLLSGYTAVRLIFNDFQVITMVFSTTLIGIGIDYSYHYFFAENIDKNFVKNLSFSFITSVIPFALLFITGIELLKQIAVFSVFGLLAVYLTVLFIYPVFNAKNTSKTVTIKRNFYKIFLITFSVLAIAGIFRFKFNDSLTSLYTPSYSLQKAESLYNKLEPDEFKNPQIITVKGNDIKDIIFNEENITSELIENNIDYYSVSKILPSEKIQRENFSLVKELYSNNLFKYADLLTDNQIKTLSNSTFTPVDFDFESYPFLKNFMLDDNTSMIFVASSNKPNISSDKAKIINYKADIEKCLKNYRHLIMLIFPLVIIILWVLLSFLYNVKTAVKILIPSCMGILFAMLLTSLVCGEINLFSVISIFLVLGFTIDYSIFRVNSAKSTETAIFVSFCTTSFSFLLLSLCGFKLLSTMSLVIFFGIIVSYITGYLLFSEK